MSSSSWRQELTRPGALLIHVTTVAAALCALAAVPVWFVQSIAYSDSVGIPQANPGYFACRANAAATVAAAGFFVPLALRLLYRRATAPAGRLLVLAERTLAEHVALVALALAVTRALDLSRVQEVIQRLADQACSR